jgi:hypothetical protein
MVSVGTLVATGHSCGHVIVSPLLTGSVVMLLFVSVSVLVILLVLRNVT